MSVKITNESFKDFTSSGVVLVDFWAGWCNPCKVIGPIIDQLSNEYTNAKIGKVDVDNNKNLAQDLGIRSIPTILIYKDGEIVERHTGVASKSQLKGLIDKHLV